MRNGQERADLECLLDRIDMPQEMRDSIFLYADGASGAGPALLPGTQSLTEHLLRALRNRAQGPWSGLPEDVFVDTMKAFSRFVREYHRSWGVFGFDRDFWTTRQADADLFRIGELEYELNEEEDRICLHIPSDAKLAPELLNDSCAAARAFLKEYAPAWCERPVYLHSWLLWPGLSSFLAPDSRIMNFRKAFDFHLAEENSTDYLEWVFQVAPGQLEGVNLQTLPEQTSLQRGLKKYVLGGGRVGTGKGILARSF